MKYNLRPYQQEAVEKMIWSFQLEGNSLISLPTGSGKSLIIAELAKRLDQNILILQPSREITIQNYEKLTSIVPKEDVGVYSASLNSREIKKFTLATIGSVYKKPEQFSHFKVVILDECHLLNPKRLGSMYTSFFYKMGHPKVFGLSATCYRLTQQYVRYKNGFVDTITTIKLINRVRCKDGSTFWNRLIFNINVGDLIAQGFLSPLKYNLIDLISQENMKLNISHSDFDLTAFEKQIEAKEIEIHKVIEACSQNCKSTLVFCATVDQAEKFAEKYECAEVVSAKSKPKDRKRIIEGFKNGKIKMVFNVGVLTTGFDHPALDCIILLRPTRSIGLYYQMVGRGLRKCEGKEYCRIVDMTDTVKQIGRVETIKMERIDNKWELTSERGLWHGRELYKFSIQK